MPQSVYGKAPAAFDTLPAPSPTEHRWCVSPDECPSDTFLADWYNAAAEDRPLDDWLRAIGWLVTDTGTRIAASKGNLSLHLTREPGGGYRVAIGPGGPAWMSDNSVVHPFDFLVHCGNNGNRQDALDGVLINYRRQLKSYALHLAMAYPDTDAGNMERLVDRWHQDCRYSDTIGWHIWDGTVWRRQDGKDSVLLMARMRETIRFAAWGIANPPSDVDAKEADAKRKHLVRSENTSRLRAALDQARSHGALMAGESEFDQRPWTVGFHNGVWKDGRFMPHDRLHRITRLMPAEYRQDATEVGDSEWSALLDRMVSGDESKTRMLQEIAGAAIGGGANNRILPWLYGPGGTGKTTFLDLLMAAMGDASLALGQDMVSGHGDAEKLGVAALGRRLLVLQEMGNQKVDTSLAKRLTGGDPLHARFLYSSTNFTVKPTWLVIAASNDAPSADAGDATFWQTRMRVVGLDNPLDLGTGDFLTFTSSTGRRPAALPEVRRDPASPLVQGFVRWAMAGAKRLCETGREIAWTQAVRDATEEMRREVDPVGEFVTWLISRYETGLRRGGVHQRDIGAEYQTWCQDNNIRHPLGKTRLYKHLEANGFRKGIRDSMGDRWLLPAEDTPPMAPRMEHRDTAPQGSGYRRHWEQDQPAAYLENEDIHAGDLDFDSL